MPWQERATLQITESSVIRYQVKDYDSVSYDDQVLMILNKLNVTLDARPVRVGLRLDSSLMFTGSNCSEQVGGPCPIRSEHGFERTLPEKVFVEWSENGISVRGGDFYTSWGQGLVLNLKKVDELGVDTTLRGGRVRVQKGMVSVEALGGVTNIQNLELFKGSYEVLEDPNDVMAGAQALLTLENGAEVGVRGVQTWFDTPENYGHEESTTVAGGSFSLPTLGDWFALYFEGATLQFRDYNPEKDRVRNKPGSALYGRVNGFFGPVTMLVEGKRYRRFRFETQNGDILLKTPVFYHLSPTLERYDQQVFNNSDTDGIRTKMEYLIRSIKLRLFANGLWSLYGPSLGDDPWDEKGREMFHGYAGVRQKFKGGTSLEVSAGWREERERKSGELYRKMWHVETDISVPVTGPHALAMKAEMRNEVKDKPFSRGLASLTYSLQPSFSVSGLYGYSTEKEDKEPVHHAAAQFDYDIAKWGTLRVFGGSVPGGIVCAGGTCVYVPSALNYRTELVARF